MAKEVMKWYVDPKHAGWFVLKMSKYATFRNFLDDVLGRKEDQGVIYIHGIGDDDSRYETILYQNGMTTWFSNDILNRIDDSFVLNGQAHGFTGRVDYHINVKCV